jgi:hypothetical protein
MKVLLNRDKRRRGSASSNPPLTRLHRDKRRDSEGQAAGCVDTCGATTDRLMMGSAPQTDDLIRPTDDVLCPGERCANMGNRGGDGHRMNGARDSGVVCQPLSIPGRRSTPLPCS